MLLEAGRNCDGRDRREGGDVRVGLRCAQGGVANQVPSDGGAHSDRRELDQKEESQIRGEVIADYFSLSMCT